MFGLRFVEEVLQALPQEAAWGPRSRAVVQVATGDSRGEGLTVSREARGQGGMRSAQALTSSRDVCFPRTGHSARPVCF